MLSIRSIISWKFIKKNLKQIGAITERNLYIESRFKTNIFLPFIRPFLQILMPLIIFCTIFNIRADYQFGYWNSYNYMLFLIIAFCIQILRQTIVKYRKMFQHEKYWKTLQALLVAPINHFNILIGLLIAEIILISIPITIFLIIAIIIYPISFFNMLLVILMILVISLTFGSIGLIIGILIISKEGFYKIIDIGFTFLFWLSCISYPIQIFPELVRIVILLNPLYYLFDLLRLIWLVGIDPVLAINYLSPAHIIIASVMLISLPIIAVYLFNVFYKKFGITGY